ncbi:MAG: hypothetical protein R3F59_29315 [Myxococcota bacterium]
MSWYNQGHEDSKILVPMVDAVFPAAAGDPAALGERSVQVLFAATLLVLTVTVVQHVQDLRRPAS